MAFSLVIGGARSGKSAFAEKLICATRADYVRYGATGPTTTNDPAWEERVALHQARRPSQWDTVVSCDPATLLASFPTTGHSALLLDDLPSWVTHQLSDLTDWETCTPGQHAQLLDRANRFATDIAACAAQGIDIVVVTLEAGWGVSPATTAGNIFRDVLGDVNQLWAAAADSVTLVVAGLPLSLKPSVTPLHTMSGGS